MLNFSDLEVGEFFKKYGYVFKKHSDCEALDHNGNVAVLSADSPVERITNVATRPDILSRVEPSYETRITRLTITPRDSPLYCESGYNVEIVDEAAGEFVRVSGTQEGELKIDPSEWPQLQRAIDRMIKRCRSHED